MKKIKLTNGKYTLVDDDDFEKFGKMRWRMDYHGYAIMSKQFGFKGPIKTILLHREIMNVAGKKGIDVDHINKNPLDNRKENLRLCSRSQNKANVNKNINNSSGYKGVHWNKRNNRWVSSITKNYKKYNLGYFKDKIKAARAYDLKAKELFSEFASTNF